MADNYAERMSPEQALALIRLGYLIRETCADYAVTQPAKKLSNWRHRVLIDVGHARLPQASTLRDMAAQLGLPAKVVDRWIADQPDAVSGER